MKMKMETMFKVVKTDGGYGVVFQPTRSATLIACWNWWEESPKQKPGYKKAKDRAARLCSNLNAAIFNAMEGR